MDVRDERCERMRCTSNSARHGTSFGERLSWREEKDASGVSTWETRGVVAQLLMQSTRSAWVRNTIPLHVLVIIVEGQLILDSAVYSCTCVFLM